MIAIFTIRPYAENDAACGECLYEGFFTAPAEDCDKVLLRDYAQVLIEKCNFTYVAETEEGQVGCGRPPGSWSICLRGGVRGAGRCVGTAGLEPGDRLFQFWNRALPLS